MTRGTGAALPTISACLVTWRRPDNLRMIVERLVGEPFIGEVLVWRNDPAVAVDLPWAKVRIIDSPRNAVCHGRYLCAAQAAHPLVYTQDDDVLVHDVALLLRQFLADPGRIHFNLGDWHFPRRDRHLYGDCHSALVGWGAVFATDWLAALDAVPDPVRASPLFEREADQYFTLLQRRHHAAHHASLTNLEGHSTAGLALWCAPEHWRMSSLAVRDALRLVRASRGFALPPPWHVVVTCRDGARHLEESVESVAFNDADYELTIVDDASRDDTPEVVRALRSRHPGIRGVRLPEPAGASRARNIGISAIDSAFVVVLDAGDRLGGDYLFEAGRVLAAGADVANPDALLFGAGSGRWSAPEATTLAALQRHNSIHYCAAFRRSWWSELGGFDERIASAADHDFWLRAVARGARVCAVPGDHFHHRRGSPSDSGGLHESQAGSSIP